MSEYASIGDIQREAGRFIHVPQFGVPDKRHLIFENKGGTTFHVGSVHDQQIATWMCDLLNDAKKMQEVISE